MDSCCEDKSRELAALRGRQARVLKIALGLNGAMFGIEFVAGLFAGSTALLGDSLDMLGDSLVYAFTLFVLQRGAAWRARAALAKGLVMGAFGLGVLFEAARSLLLGSVPAAATMGAIGALALAANLACFLLLLRHRSDDLNMRSTWLCSRNDIIGNVAVLISAAAVARFGSNGPDVLVGAAIALLFLRSAFQVLGGALGELADGREVSR